MCNYIPFYLTNIKNSAIIQDIEKGGYIWPENLKLIGLVVE